MLRACLVILGAAALAAVDAQTLLAQDAPGWPGDLVPFERGSGSYFSLWKIVPAWLLFALWVHTTDWISRDCKLSKLSTKLWNSVAVGAFAGTFLLLFLMIPWFLFGFFLLLVSYIAPLATYILKRNKIVAIDDRVLTRPHLRRWSAEMAARAGLKFSAEKKDPRDAGPEVKFNARGAPTERDDKANELKARQMPGIVSTRELLNNAVKMRADGILLDYGREFAAVRHQVDGVWLDAPKQERVSADPMLEVLKTLAALNPADRRARQAGQFGIETDGKKFDCRITSQGTETGERAVLLLEGKKLSFKTLEEAGMRAKMIEQLNEVIRRKEGFLLLASTPANGLSTTFDLTLMATDRFIRNFVAVEDEAKHERDIENVQVTKYSSLADETPDTVLPKLIRTYPDVFVVRDLVNAETVSLLCEQVTGEHRFAFASVRAKEAVEALLRVLVLKAPPAEFAAAMTAVLNVRLVRKLCEKCKEAYAPPPDVLKSLGLPQGKVAAFYRPPTKPLDPKHPEKKCEACLGVAYVGRTGIFELLMIDDRMREILASTPKLDLLRDAARKAKHRSLQEEGILLVVRGVTSLPEVLRVLKG